MNKLKLKNGNLYFDHDLYEKYFNSINSVVLLKKEAVYLIMPVQQASGGLLLKIRNAKGDRIVHAIEFFQHNSIEIEKEIILNVEWNAELAALTFLMP